MAIPGSCVPSIRTRSLRQSSPGFGTRASGRMMTFRKSMDAARQGGEALHRLTVDWRDQKSRVWARSALCVILAFLPPHFDGCGPTNFQVTLGQGPPRDAGEMRNEMRARFDVGLQGLPGEVSQCWSTTETLPDANSFPNGDVKLEPMLRRRLWNVVARSERKLSGSNLVTRDCGIEKASSSSPEACELASEVWRIHATRNRNNGWEARLFLGELVNSASACGWSGTCRKEASKSYPDQLSFRTQRVKLRRLFRRGKRNNERVGGAAGKNGVVHSRDERSDMCVRLDKVGRCMLWSCAAVDPHGCRVGVRPELRPVLTTKVCEDGTWKSKQTWPSASASEEDPSSLIALSLEPTARAWAGVRLRASTRAALRSPNAVSNTCSASCEQDEREGRVFLSSVEARIASERCCAKCTTASASSTPDSARPASARKPLARWIATRLDIMVDPQRAPGETVGLKRGATAD
ncbi:hypothetical protein L1887_52022 [Cichorium endivia]|nr:hypothetical protein L1887_52022 [Cichorium endivia]